MGPVIIQNVSNTSTTCKKPTLEKTCDSPKLPKTPSYQKNTPNQNYLNAIDLPVQNEFARISTSSFERHQLMSMSSSDSSCTTCSDLSNSSSSSECEDTDLSYNHHPDVNSSPDTYYSTSSSSSCSSLPNTFSSRSRSASPPNIRACRRYLPLSPATYPKKLFCGDYSPLSPTYSSLSPTYLASPQCSPTSPNHSFALPHSNRSSFSQDYTLSTQKNKSANTDYFLRSPQSPVRYNVYSPPNYLRLSNISLNDNAPKPSSFINHSPASSGPSSPQYYPMSPDYSSTSLGYQNVESTKQNASSSYSEYFSKQFSRSSRYIAPKSSQKYYYNSSYCPLTPKFIPSMCNGNIEEDVPCVCCSSSFLQY